jgi:hypothetical protein
MRRLIILTRQTDFMPACDEEQTYLNSLAVDFVAVRKKEPMKMAMKQFTLKLMDERRLLVREWR